MGSDTITATLAADTNYITASGTNTLTITNATPTITTWPTATEITYGETLASSTLSGGAASVAGSFSWQNSSAVPTLGTASYAVVFTPSNATYTTVTGTASVTAVDYSVTSTGSTNQTILPGGSATFTYNLTPTTGTTLPVAATITVTGLPSGATATLSGTGWTALTSTSWQLPANTATGTTTLTITAPSSTTANNRNDSGLGRRFAPIALGLLLLPFAGSLRRASKRLGRYGMLMLLLAAGAFATVGLSGCGGSADTFFAQSQKSYTVTVTVAAGSLMHTDTVTLTVE